MTDNDLLTPRVRGIRTWNLLAGLSTYLCLAIWLANQERFLSRDIVELSVFDINITSSSIYCSAFAILKLSSAGIIGFIKKYGLKQSLWYLAFVSSLSYVLVVYILDWGTLRAASLVQNNLVSRLENSVVEIEEVRGPIKQRHTTGVVPYSIEEHTKYPGEDVIFTCYRLVSHPAELRIHPHPDQVVWEKGGEKVQPSDHVNISWTFENITNADDSKDGLIHYLISSNLTVTFIDEEDFANYSCLVKNTVIVIITERIKLNKPKPPMCPLTPPPPCICLCLCDAPSPPKPRLELPMDKSRWKDNYSLVKVSSLVRMKALVRVVHAPPGGIVSFTATYDQLAEWDDVSFDYTIGRKPFESLCGGLLEECSLLVKLYWIFFHKGGHDMVLTFNRGSVRMQTAVRGTGWQCVCKQSYNYHEFWFYRRIYNSTSGREEIREVKYPHSVILAPRTPDLFFPNFTNKVDPLAKPPCWIGTQQVYQTKYCAQDEYWVEWTLWLVLNGEIIALMCTLLFSLITVVLVSYLLTKTVVIPVRNKILEGSFRPCPGCVKTSTPLGFIHEDEHAVPKHDVYISHADEELLEGFQLTRQLEQIGLSVFLPHRNVLGGQYLTDAISAAITSSKLFVVILTKKYVESGMQNRFEFQLIFRKALKTTADYKKLLILKRENVNVPPVLNEFSILDWTLNEDIEKKNRCLKNWAEGKVNRGQICVC